MVAVRFVVNALLLFVLPTIAATTSTVPRDVGVQKPTTSFNKGVSAAEHDGFYFENPETDCKYVSQPYIYKAFKTLETDLTRLFTLIHRDVEFTIVGHHPGAGKYHDLMHFFVNALRRVSITGSEHNDAFKVIPKAIHGGCDQEWSVAEINFQGITNSGTTFDIINVWITRWSRYSQMVEVRTYIDSTKVSQLLHENENWWNATRHTDHHEYMPGPAGMPNITELESLMPEYDDEGRPINKTW